MQPTPVAGIVSLEKGSTLRVNGGRFTNTDPAAALRLVVSWGDGERGEIGCGPCRLEHAYPRVGSFSVRVTVVSGQAAGLTEASEEFTVVVSPATAPRVTHFTATPAIVQLGSSSTLTWETENAISVAISPGSGGLEPRGSTTVTPTQASTTFTLTAVDVDGQEATASVTVAVLAPAIGSFTATPSAIDLGASSTLAWSGITGATSCSIDQGIGTVSCAGGATSVSPTATTTYTLTARGPGGSNTSTATVTVQYCHSIVSADGACPTGATRYCQATPIVATSSSHAQSALLACFGADASTTANSCSAVPRGRTDISSRTTYYYDTCSSLGAVAGDIWRPSTGTFIGRWAN